ncbi:MAG: restriction endonuclease subunit S [Hymenobacter sp.]|nr:MAG: restriction endonuclease subunit S [Hymenobacter sp.]
MKNGVENSILETPKDWRVKALGDVASINMGQSPSSSAYNEEENGIPLIQGNADIKKRKTVPRTWTTEFPKECQVGDIIMTVRAPVGAIARSLHHACLGRGVCAITSKVVDNGYLYQYLLSYETKWAAIEQGSTFTAVNGNEIRKIEILLPPLAEQRKIAEILSTLDEKMTVIDEQLAQTQELKKGLMQRLLTKGIGHTQFKNSPLGQIPASWHVAHVEEIATIKTGAKDTQNKEELGKYPFFVRSQTIERINTYSFDGESVLTAGDGVGVGKVFH